MEGWIKLNRDLLESRQFVNPVDLKIWLWLMLKASTVDRFALLKIGKGNTTVEVKRGQLIFGRNKAEQELKIDGSTIYRVLQRFQEEKIISINANNQFSIITVNDFIETQTFEETDNLEFEEIEQPKNNQRTTKEQPMSNQRTSNEQLTNTVEESKESKQGSEFEESEKGKETPAPSGNLFGDPELPKNGKKKKEKGPAPQKEKIVLPWISPEFTAAWDNWKQFKAGEFKFNYKTIQSEQAALLELSNISNGSEIDAIKIINKSMAKGWKGLFALKPEDYATDQQSNGNGLTNGNHKDRGAHELLASLEQDRRTYYNGKDGN